MSLLLVFLQFLLIGLIAVPFHMPVLSIVNLAVFGLGVAVFFAAFFAMRIQTFTVMPEPKKGGELVTRGIYRLVRHPMYLAVLLCAVGACMAYGSSWKWFAAVLLLVVLGLKMRREEQYLLQSYEGYAAYRKRSKAIIPFIL